MHRTGSLSSSESRTSVLSEIFKSGFPAAQDLVCVSLMTDIPDHLVIRKIKNTVQCNSQFHNTQIGCKMAAGLADLVNQKIPDFPGKNLHLWICQFFNITRFVYLF